MKTVSELIAALEHMSQGLQFYSSELTNRSLPHIEELHDRDYALKACADLRVYSQDLVAAIEFIKDWNSRQKIPH